MNAILQAQFQRVETALNTLIDSITSYNPSPQAAVALIDADDELSKGLELLSTHQANHARLLALQETTTTLSSQITTALTLLSSTRQDVLATPATTFPSHARDVPYDELLAYAKKISKFTVPPTHRPRAAGGGGGAAAATSTSAAANKTQSNGDETTDANANANANETNDEGAETGVGVAALAPHESQWVNPAAPPWFIPWPSDETIRRGALAGIQARVDAGLDPAAAPAAVDSAEEEGKARREEEEQRRRREEEEEERRRAETEREKARRGSRPAMSAGEAREEKPAVFSGLDLYDPEDD